MSFLASGPKFYSGRQAPRILNRQLYNPKQSSTVEFHLPNPLPSLPYVASTLSKKHSTFPKTHFLSSRALSEALEPRLCSHHSRISNGNDASIIKNKSSAKCASSVCFSSIGSNRNNDNSKKANPRLSLFYKDVLSLTSSQELLHFALKIQGSYIYNKHDLLLLLQQLAILQHVRSSSSTFRCFWDRAFPAILLHKGDAGFVRLCFLKLVDTKCSVAVFQLVILVPELQAGGRRKALTRPHFYASTAAFATPALRQETLFANLICSVLFASRAQA